MAKYLLSILFFLNFVSAPFLWSQTRLDLVGYLGSEEIEAAKKKIQDNPGSELLIQVNSTSGELKDVFALVKEIFAIKAEKGTRVTVYIRENALGPSAMLPFLADKLFTSHYVSWGDISHGSDGTVPVNILKNAVVSLISPSHPEKEKLELIAAAMSDPSVSFEESDTSKNDALVLNHNQLRALELIEVVAPEAFWNRYEKQPVVSIDALGDKLKQHIRFSSDQTNKIGLIQVNEKTSQISQSTWVYIKNALEYYQKSKPSFVILELNTPGGEVFAAQKISDALKELDTQYDIPVVAFINNWAISAGAMLAYSCRFITVTKDASMGAAEPVQAGESGQMVTASEKVNSALRTDFANRAAFFNRNSLIAEAMVDKDLILVWRNGKVVKLEKEDAIRPGDDVISSKGKLLTLSSEEMIKYHVVDLLLIPEKVPLITAAEREKGSWPAEKMLLFQTPFFKKIPNAVIDVYQMDLKTRVLTLLTSPAVTSLLFMGMLVGFYVEINSPGFGFPGSMGVVCLSLLIISSFALDVANILELVLLLVGLAFIALDVFLIPTFGILGIVGIVFFFVGLFGMLLPGIETVDFEYDTKTFNAAGEVFMERLVWLSGALVLSAGIIIALATYVMPRFKGFQRFVLAGEEQSSEKGYISGADPKTLPQIGREGNAMTSMRPAGKVVFGNEIFEALSSGDYIEKGALVRVVKLDGSTVIVEEVTL